MSLQYPLALLLAVVVLIPWIWGRGTSLTHRGLRSLILLLLVLALARPVWLRRDAERGYQVYVHEPVASAWVEAQRERVHGGGDDVVASVAIEGSLSQALEAGLAQIPEGSRGAITLVSSGTTTDPHWGNALRQCQERNLPLHVVSMPPEEVSDLRLIEMAASQRMRVGQSVALEVEALQVPGGQAIELIDVEAEAVLGTHFQEGAEDRVRLRFEFEPPRPGFLRLGVRAGEQLLEQTFAVEAPLRVLYLGERMQAGDASLQSLLGQGVALETPGAPGLPALEGYDLVMIDDYPASRWEAEEQQRLIDAVSESGLGLAMSGGMAAFGPGGYGDSLLAKALPVEFMQKEEKRDPSTALAVIIDTSGSMSGERVQLAKEVARLAIRRLLPHDKVGIVEFYGTKQWAAPIQSAANAIDIQRALNRLDAGGGTVIMPAIEEAYYAMQNVQTRYKHVLVLTDGGVEAGEFEPLLRKMAAKGMNVSTVLVGGDTHSEFLVNLANWGKGHFYSASNRFNIPEILLKQPSTSKIPAYRPGEHNVSGRGGPGWWGEVRPQEVPPLRGYVETRAREEAEVLLETTEQRHPLLATWKLGLGRVTSLMTEPVGQGTRDWQSWEDYGPWLARILARTAREERLPFAFEARREGERVTVLARKLVHAPWVPLVERLGAEEREAVPLERRSPEVWAARWYADPGEELRFQGSVASQPFAPQPFVSNAFADLTPPAHWDPAAAVPLGMLAEATGGSRELFAEVAAFRPPLGGGSESLHMVKVWNLCLLLALFAYLVDVTYRRWPTRELS